MEADAPPVILGVDVHAELTQALAAVFHPLGVRFQFSIQALPETDQQRLWIRCTSSQRIDYQLLTMPLVGRLRSMGLENFQDAVLRGHNLGTNDDDWRLRINLTPARSLLTAWARWGDIQAISQLANLALETQGLRVAGMLKNWRLHLFCTGATVEDQGPPRFPHKSQALGDIIPLLQQLSPQGIQGATIYGVQSLPQGLPAADASPLWVHWLDLPAATDPRYTLPPLALAEQGDLEALTFVLQRLLNPDLEQCLAQGAIELSLLVKKATLHVMSEAPLCPVQSQMVEPTLKVLRQLSLPAIDRIRIYGRVAGQQLPGWSYGQELSKEAARLTPSPEPTPTPTSLMVSAPWRARLLQGDWLGAAGRGPAQPIARGQVLPWAAAALVAVGAVDRLMALGFSSDAPPPIPVKTLVSSKFSFNNPQLDEKLAQYREFCASGSPDVLIVGSSRAMRGVNPQLLQRSLVQRGYPATRIYNLGVNGATAQLVDLMLRRLVEPTQLPKLVIWADGARAFNDGRPDRTYNAILSSPGYGQLAQGSGSLTVAAPAIQAAYDRLDRSLNRLLAKGSATYGYRHRLPAQLAQLIPGGEVPVVSSASSGVGVMDDTDRLDGWGFLPLATTFTPATYYQQYARVAGDSDADYASFTLTGGQDGATRQLTDFLKQQRIPLIFVNVPLSDYYLDRVRQGHELTFKQYMQGLAREGELQFIDLVGSWVQEYDLYSDPSHLNRQGATRVTSYLAQNAPIDWSVLATDPRR